MINWLLQRFIQDVPEEISFCEFECPRSKCCMSDWAVCDLNQKAMPSPRSFTRYRASVRDDQPELPVFARLTNSMTL
jgi:hypothetical protein